LTALWAWGLGNLGLGVWGTIKIIGVEGISIFLRGFQFSLYIFSIFYWFFNFFRLNREAEG